MARTVFVTGGSGFIGGALVRRLVAEGNTVRALARSERSAEKVSALGAEPVSGDLGDPGSLRTGAGGAELAFHAAAELGDWGRREDFERGNVEGTRNVVEACRAAGVRRLVHVGTEAAILAGQPLDGATEEEPLRPDSKAMYSATKAQAERIVRDANGEGFETVVVRPRFVWGPGDTNVLPELAAAVEEKRFAWVGGGTNRTSTTHVDNTVEGLILGAERGRPGEAYFVTDGEPVVFREFVTALLATRGVEAPERSVPRPVARIAANTIEPLWSALRLRSRPPVTRFGYWVSALDCVIDDSRAREELGYRPVKSVEEGLRELREASAHA